MGDAEATSSRMLAAAAAQPSISGGSSVTTSSYHQTRPKRHHPPSGSPMPKAMVALNSQVAPSGYRATPVRRSFLTTPQNCAGSPEQMGKLSLAMSQRSGKPG